MDITNSLAPRSDQLNADDLISGPITVTIAEVTPGKAEQPYDFQLVEYPGRAYRPSLGMRRVIANAWGGEASKYAGRKLTLYRDPDITFGKDKIGGIRISHMSDIDGPVPLALTVSRGRRITFTVQPLKGATPRPSAAPVQDPVLVDEWLSVINDATTLAQLEAAWHGINAAGIAKDPRIIAAKNARKAELNAA